MTNFNLGYNCLSVDANLMKLHLLVHHHEGYNLTKNKNSSRLFDKIMRLYKNAKMDCVLITRVSIVCDKDLTDERWPPHAGLLLTIFYKFNGHFSVMTKLTWAKIASSSSTTPDQLVKVSSE